MARITLQEAGSVNLLAFIDVVHMSEIGAAMLAMPETDSGYKVLVGSRPSHLLLFQDYSHHPHILNHALDSTAAGASQIIFPTWSPIQKRLGLTDFGPVNQDRATIELFRECHAYQPIVDGDIEHALTLCNQTWASFPGAGAALPDGSPQHTNRTTDLLNAYEIARAKYMT